MLSKITYKKLFGFRQGTGLTPNILGFGTILLLLYWLNVTSSYAQAGKDGALTVTTANTVLNRYTRVTTDVTAGSNVITVVNINDLNRDGIGYLPAGFVTNSSVYANNALSPGDLIIIYQAQGAIINSTNTINYGQVTNYNGAGTYEFAQVASVSGNNITLACRTKYSYFAARYVQVIRVPQYTTLTVNAGASVVAVPWGAPSFGGADPSALERRRGGFMVVHATNIVNNGTIHANAAGFRGGTIDPNTSPTGNNFSIAFVTNSSNESAEKGESIAGYRDDYDNLYNGRYGRGAPANGGGGGNGHNAGGGGGANGGNPAGWFRGAGVMNSFGTCGNPGAWALDPDYIANGNALTNSQGGGRGGYSFGSSNQNACTLGPSYPANFIAPGIPAADVQNTAWGGDNRDAVGGLGGRPIVSANFQNQIFFGGGGGAGDGNNGANADGGDGGGIVFLIATGNITGSGTISANGENGFNTISGHNDAPGGGGGGGTVAIQATSIANTINIRANGGNGGNQLITNNESEGPGGGGGGGVIVINATTDGSTKQVNGGQNGTTTSAAVTEFTANGATSGNSGTISSVSVSLFSIVCTSNLGINKAISNSSPNVGTNVTFTLTASNAGPDPATNVVVNDLLPAGYTFVSATPSQGTYNNVTGVWNVGSLGIGGSATLTIVATVNASGPYTNTATISTPDQNDPNTSNNTSSVTPTPVPQTNLGVTKTASNMTPPVGSNITFTITANNAGPSNATGVVVNDVLPSGYTFVSATTSQGTYNNVSGVWSVGALANGASATLTITVTVNASGSYANTATITGDQADPVAGNNSSTATPTPVPQTNLGVTKTASNMTPPVGSNITFTITANNAGPSNATGVVVNDVLPSGYTFVSATASQGTYNNVSGVWSIGALANGASATLTITVTVNASGSYTNTATISGDQADPVAGNNSSTATPTPVNVAPDAVNDNYTMAQNGNLSNSVATNDILQAGGNPHTFTLVSGGSAAANGTLTFNPDGTFTYVPNTGFSGTVSFTYQVCNGVTPINQCDTAVATIVVLPPPVAVNDNAVTPINTPVSGNLSTNDNLPSGGTYTYTIATPPNPAQGTVTINPDGTYTFTPATGFTGTATFTYQVCNQLGQCSTATVSVLVLPPPVAVNDTANTPINTPVNGNASTNDNLPSGGTYTYTVTTPPANGSVTMNPDGTYTYTPNTGFTGTDVFTYQVCNQVGQCSTATVTINVVPAPVANDDSYTMPQNGSLSNSVVGNDVLPASGNPHTFSLVSGGSAAANGTLTFNPDGTFTYVPNTGFSGTVSFTYQVCNSLIPAQCDTAVATIVVLPPPVAVNDNAVTPINTPVSGNLSTNDNLPSGGTYTYTIATPPNPAQGTVTINPDGTYTFTPATGFTGTATFTYQVCNQLGQCSTATVSVLVLPPPVAVNDTANTPINTPVNGNASTNDNLPSGGTYTYTVTTPPANGSVTMNPDGTYTYTPNTGFTGTDVFTYQVCNQVGQCSTATVTINVVPAPVANDDSYTMPQNGSLSNSVVGNDVLPASGNPHTFSLVSGGSAAANGTLTFNPDGTFTYVPNTGFSGTVSFTYQVCNSLIPAQCDTAVATIVVLPPPVAVNDSAVTPINTPVNGNLSSNDNLPAGGTYTYTVATPPNPAQGTVTINPDGTYTFTPATGFTGTASFTYQVCNQLGQCSTATVSVLVLPPPVAVNDTANTPINTPVNGNASTNDNLPSGGTYTYTVTTPPANGSVTMNPDGTYTYTPNTGFTGTDVFTYQVCNQVGQCSTATVTITVPANPVAVNDNYTTPINTPVGGNLAANDLLPTGFTYTFSLVNGGSAASNGTLVVNPDGTYNFTPNTGFSGVVSFTYQVCNQVNVCSTATVTITILAPPVASNDTAGTQPNTPVNGNVSPNDNLPAGGTYTFTVTTPPANGNVTMNPDGSYTYTPNPGFVGTDTFTYTVCNQLGQCSTATVTITVGQPPLAVNDEYNTGAGIPVSGNVGTNDQNPSGGTTTFNLVSGGTATQNGTLVFNPNGIFTFTPNPGFSGTVTFTYEICNPVGCSQATVTINVAPPVQAVDDNYTTTPNNPVSGNLGTNDVVPAGQAPTFSLVNGGTATQNGTLVVNPDGSFTFTPNPGFVGTVTFTYQVCNQFGQCSTATVTIVIEDPVVQIPEGFSPNNDGINDNFVIKGRNGRPVVLRIYNRWGNLVYENLNYQDDWNGTSNIGIRIGEQLPDGTYFYTAEFKDTGERYARYLTIQR
ncbi:Ig-like domain-containing protein [Raineya orbicola]|uniref:Conserved repeat domain n=1 Tax=Raineya orbicola TaxID=2016530 RepID=A0A2N3IHP3_9BACT|nr:Ig-like domain-containing protein [Raineya orbicola]PKQ69743.1 Conserved repeat domain [Raineya orbicola]